MLLTDRVMKSVLTSAVNGFRFNTQSQVLRMMANGLPAVIDANI